MVERDGAGEADVVLLDPVLADHGLRLFEADDTGYRILTRQDMELLPERPVRLHHEDAVQEARPLAVWRLQGISEQYVA